MLVRRMGYRLKDVAGYLGRDAATIATMLSRMNERLAGDIQEKREIERLGRIVDLSKSDPIYPLVREWSPPVATGGLAGAPLRPARLALLNRDRLDVEAGHSGVACFGLPKPRHPCPWNVNAAAVLDSSKREP